MKGVGYVVEMTTLRISVHLSTTNFGLYTNFRPSSRGGKSAEEGNERTLSILDTTSPQFRTSLGGIQSNLCQIYCQQLVFGRLGEVLSYQISRS